MDSKSDFNSLFNDNLSEKNQYLLDSISTQKTYKKNEFLLKPGRPASSIFLLQKVLLETIFLNPTKK